jgi:hypothetical protein
VTVTQDLTIVDSATFDNTSIAFSQPLIVNDTIETTGGIKLNADRIAMQELTSGALSVSGWYTIAEKEPSSPTGRGNVCDFKVFFGNSSAECSISFVDSGSPRTHQNTTIVHGKYGKAFSGLNEIKGFRLAKSDTTVAGFKIQVKVANTSPLSLGVQLNSMISESTTGIVLVDPYLDNTPTLPDGITVATFLEAGEELQFPTVSSLILFVPNAIGLKVSNDAVDVSILWDQIPKQGSQITLQTLSGFFIDGNGILAVIGGSVTFSNFSITGKYVSFRANQIGIATNLNAGAIALRLGVGNKLTIT